ncbi:hypothetical protein [Micromonospora sp. NPDC049282]|uniref:hypothetical protein n=1 Tax=Micromonospora sp. NPDC049282 TaxID=3364269 RepID=UPI00371E24FD
MTTPVTTQVGLRFVQLRREGDAAPGACTTGPKLIDAVVDFRDAWSDPVREVVTDGDDDRARRLLAKRLAAKDDRLDELGRQTLWLLLRVAVDARLTVGELRDGIAGWATEHDLDAGQLASAAAELTGWVVDVLVLGRFLRIPRSPVAVVLVRVLRGMTLLRLARSDADAACLVRALLGGRDVLLPDPPAPPRTNADADRADRFADLGQTLRRLRSRADAVGLTDATVQDLRNSGFPDLGPAISATAQAAADLGVPDTTTLSRLARVFSAEQADARRRATAKLTGGDFEPIPSHPGPADPLPYPGQPKVPVLDAYTRIAGRGDLMIIRTALLRYQPGEISYLENVLASETRGRSHVADTSTSETVTTTSKRIDASTEELASTEQNSLDRALATAASQQNSTSLGVSVSGGLGPVRAGIEVNADQSTSTETSSSSAVSYAKTLTESATQLLRTETGQRRTTTSTVRVTETNTHSFDNSAGTADISGVYRWLDKVDQARVYNYGERLMLEFIVPEPAATLVWLDTRTSEDTSLGAVPKPPAWFLDVDDLDDDNWAAKAARWDIFGVEPPPDPEVFATATFVDPAARPFDYPKNSTDKSQPEWGYASYTGEVAVPAGYEASRAYVWTTWGLTDGEYATDAGSPPQAAQIAVGEQRLILNDSTEGVSVVDFDQPAPGPVPIGISADQRGGLTVVVRVRCTRTDGAFEAWRLRAWESIRAGYLAQRSAYDNDQARRQARTAYQADGSAASLRQLEMLELKRACQTVLTGQEFDLYGALDTPDDEAPRIDRMQIVAEADNIQFFEEVFEWENLTYLCYPYQWAGRDRWVTVRSRTSSDPLHQAFLQAGAARVIVPVRPGYEYAVGGYLASSQVPTLSPRPWRDGGNPYPPIEELIADALDRPGEEVAVGDPWEVVTPTSLVQLQAGPDLNPPSSSGERSLDPRPGGARTLQA